MKTIRFAIGNNFMSVHPSNFLRFFSLRGHSLKTSDQNWFFLPTPSPLSNFIRIETLLKLPLPVHIVSRIQYGRLWTGRGGTNIIKTSETQNMRITDFAFRTLCIFLPDRIKRFYSIVSPVLQKWTTCLYPTPSTIVHIGSHSLPPPSLLTEHAYEWLLPPKYVFYLF